MATSVIRSPRYWGHFSWPPGKTTIHFLWKKKTLVNTVTSLIRPNVFGPLVTVLTGFRTNIFAIASCYQISKVPSRNFGGRQFFVRHENPLFIDSCPSSGHSPKKLPSIDLSGHTKFTRRSQTLSCVFHLGQCNSSNFGKFSWSWILKDCIEIQEKNKKIVAPVFISRPLQNVK